MFSKQVIADIVTLLPDVHAELDMYLIKRDLDDKIEFGVVDTIKKQKVTIAKFLISNQGIKDNYGNDIVTRVVEDQITKLVHNRYSSYYEFDDENMKFAHLPDLYRYLRLDGYDLDFDNEVLIRTLPEDIEADKKEDNIISFLDRYVFSTTKGHLQQAKGSYLAGNYAALNSQLRAYTESLLVEMASYIKRKEIGNADIISINPQNATTAMQLLAKCSFPVLDISLNEWLGDSKGYIEGFWKRLHPQGCHPGLPTLDEAVYRYQLVILNTCHIIKCFENSY